MGCRLSSRPFLTLPCEIEFRNILNRDLPRLFSSGHDRPATNAAYVVECPSEVRRDPLTHAVGKIFRRGRVLESQ